MQKLVVLAVVAAVVTSPAQLGVEGQCPMAGRAVPAGHPPVPKHLLAAPAAEVEAYEAAVASLDWAAVRADLTKLFLDSKDWWPADYGNYAPLFVRLGWHCSGGYRVSDGRGGCDGGRQRFDPERSWADNTNLDKARALLQPIKLKYGLGLSWGDLIILAGTTAIESMGGPVLGFCGGRMDDVDGTASLALGPSPEQEANYPCALNGTCKSPLGSTTVGLIYLNPQGPLGNPDAPASSGEVRDTFGRMAMNDSETVALIGGGHAFGKAHGACPAGAGPSPREDPSNPWPGNCGSGVGVDTFTSGIEGAWTTNPTKWDNEYFHLLTEYSWESHIGPGGAHQWRVVNGTNPTAPGVAGGDREPTMLMTSDVSLTKDPTGKYQQIVELFKNDLGAFENAFAHAWYKLTTRDVGPYERCRGDRVPPPQPFQYPLPKAEGKIANMTEVAADIKDILYATNSSVLPSDGKNGYRGAFVRLGYQCASTFRGTDFQGGCNGARVRLAPQRDWPVNEYLPQVMSLLEPIKTRYGKGLSWADLIALASHVALDDESSGAPMPFCSGRTDALEGDRGSEYLSAQITGAWDETLGQLNEAIAISGLTKREWVVLNGRPRSAEFQRLLGYGGSYSSASSAALSNDYFKTLLTERWEEYTAPSGKKQFRSREDKTKFMLKSDLLLTYDAELLALAQMYASDNDIFVKDFKAAWTKLFELDNFGRFDCSVLS